MSSPTNRQPVIPFIRKACRLDLRAFQVDFLAELCREENDERVYTSALWGLPRGNGKTEVAGAFALYMLVGDGSPHAEVIIAAGSRDQAAEAFKSARRMAEAGPLMRPKRHLRVLPGRKVIVYPATDSYLRVVSAEGPLQHGLRPTAVIFDEVWNQTKRDLWDALVGGLVKVPEPVLLCISTAGFDQASLLAELCRRGEEGTDPRFLYRWHGLPKNSELDYRDPKTWRVANPAMSCDHPFLRPDGLQDSLARMHEAEFRRWHLNQWTASAEYWLPAEAWGSRINKREVEEGADVALGFSGSYDGTSAGLVGCTAGGYLFVLGAWEPGTPVSRAEVDGAVRSAMRRYNVTRLACNPPGWDADIERWAEDFGDTVVVMWEVRKRQRFVDACGKFYAAVTTDRLSHDGNPQLERHLANARAKDVAEGHYIVGDDTSPITLAKAAVIAWEQAEEGQGDYLMMFDS